MVTSKSTLTVARVALRAARDALPDHARRKSPRKFTQPQLAACLIVKEFQGKDYRGIQTMLAEWSDLRQALGLTKVPHFTTLCAAAKRLLTKPLADRMLAAVLALCRKGKLLRRRSKLAAIDSTGLETRHVSDYYTRRCGRHKAHRKRRYPKLSAVCDTANHLILGVVIDRGPKPDAVEDEQTLCAALRQQRFHTLLGDAGYESERFHDVCRRDLGVRSIIPTTERGRPRKDGKPRPTNGYYRRLMQRRFPQKLYGQRWQIETVFSMLKRNLGVALRARCSQSQSREIRARILTHNIMILLPTRMFYTEQDSHRFLLDPQAVVAPPERLPAGRGRHRLTPPAAWAPSCEQTKKKET
jgi:hypothetical protein